MTYYEAATMFATHILKTLQSRAGIEGAVVAGGFLRDHYLGFTPKDLDVFIPKQSMGEPELSQVLGGAGLGSFALQCDLSYVNLEACRVFTQLGDVECPIQIIELAPGVDPAERVALHDFGLCQIHVDVTGAVHMTAAFTRDVAFKTCTLVHCESLVQYDRSMRRWDRLKDKLQGYTLVDPFEGVDGPVEFFL